MMDLSKLEQEEASMRVNAKIAIVNAQDRFHGTPLVDAKRENHDECRKVLEGELSKLKRQLKEIDDGNIPRSRKLKVGISSPSSPSSTNLAAMAPTPGGVQDAPAAPVEAAGVTG